MLEFLCFLYTSLALTIMHVPRLCLFVVVVVVVVVVGILWQMIEETSPNRVILYNM